jgi:hypothetical protein
LFQSPVLWAYWPRRIEAREGQHREVVARAFPKLAPFGTQAESSVESSKTERSRSSARTRTMLGLSGEEAAGEEAAARWPEAEGCPSSSPPQAADNRGTATNTAATSSATFRAAGPTSQIWFSMRLA